jgi:hypothetical protein
VELNFPVAVKAFAAGAYMERRRRGDLRTGSITPPGDRIAVIAAPGDLRLIFYTMFTEVAHFQWVAILKTA